MSVSGGIPGNYSLYKLEKKMIFVDGCGGNQTVRGVGRLRQRATGPSRSSPCREGCEANAYQRLRTAGWVYSYRQESTVPLYRCYNAQEHWHFASNEADCQRPGTMERLLGYAVSQ
jgi:hypothetical protein